MNTESDASNRRTIRSFVMRAGRMTAGQSRGLEEGWPKFGLQLEDGPLDSHRVFGRNAPLIMEIGFGMGQSLLQMAMAAPERDFIGVEVHRPGVGALLAGLLEHGLTNVRIYNCDAIDVLNKVISDCQLDGLQLFFPDPWHKSKHNKRRIVQPEFVELVRQKLKKGGILHMATDWEPYAEHMLEVMNAAPGFSNMSADQSWIERPAERPETKFERRGHRLGHGVRDLKFIKL